MRYVTNISVTNTIIVQAPSHSNVVR